MCLKAINMYPSISHIFIYANITDNSDLIKEYIDEILNSNILKFNKEDFYNKSLHSKNCPNREVEISQFKKAKYGIISCVALFSEGFDLPILNCVCFAENVIAEIGMIQRGTRALRKDDNNKEKIACIIIPYIVDNFSDDKPYKNIINIISQLKTIDENIEQKITFKTTDRHKNSGGNGEAIIDDKIDYVENADELGKLKMRIFECENPNEYNTEMVRKILKIEKISDEKIARDYFEKCNDEKLKKWWNINKSNHLDLHYLLSINVNNYYTKDDINLAKKSINNIIHDNIKYISDYKLDTDKIYKFCQKYDNKLPDYPACYFNNMKSICELISLENIFNY